MGGNQVDRNFVCPCTLDYLINVMYGISEMALNKDSYYLVFLLIGIYFLGEKVGNILQKQISKQHVY